MGRGGGGRRPRLDVTVGVELLWPPALGEADEAATLRILLDVVALHEVRVHCTTLDGTATAREDYQAISGTVVIPEGVAVVELSILIVDNDAPEPDEVFAFGLSNPTGAVLGASHFVHIAIVDNDPVSVGRPMRGM